MLSEICVCNVPGLLNAAHDDYGGHAEGLLIGRTPAAGGQSGNNQHKST